MTGDAGADPGRDIVLRLRDEFAADRHRVRQTLIWFVTFLIFAVLAGVVIILGAGIAMLRQTGDVLDTIEWTQAQLAVQTLQLGDISNRFDNVTRAQLDLASRLNSWQLNQQQAMDLIRNDTERHGRWITSREQQFERERIRLDDLLQRRGEQLDAVVVSVEAVGRRLDDVFALDHGVVIAGRDPGVAAGEGLSAAPGEAGIDPSRPAWARLLDSFEDVSITSRFDAVMAEVNIEGPPKDLSRTISVVAFPNGDRYEGSFENGLMHGWGIYTTQTGTRYEGQFHQDLKHGKGTLVHRSGERYSGGFFRGIRQGLGSLTLADGARFAGAFGNDMINGRGIMLYPDGGQFAGDFLNGRRHGYGIHRFPNGDVYKGEFRHDLRTGAGMYAFADGSTYEGGFVDGVRHGRGHYRFTDGTAYVGEFREGQMHGEGIRIAGDRRIRGVWHEGKHLRDLRD
jgi:hypothetical protein